MILLRWERALTALGFVVSLAGCAAVLGLEPTDVIGDADGGGEGGGDSHSVGGGDTPAFESACASAIATLDANGEETSAIVADAKGIYWAVPQDASSSLIYANVGSGNELIVGTVDDTSGNDPATILGLALDANNLYYAAWDSYNDVLTQPAALVSYGRRGSHTVVQANISSTAPGMSQIALTNNTLYWGNWKTAGTIGHLWSLHVPFTTTDTPTLVSGGISSPEHFEADAIGNVYYDEVAPALTYKDPQTQVALLKSTGGPNEIDTSSSLDIQDLAVDERSTVFWSDTSNGTVRMQPLGGTTAVLAAVPYPHLLAYDADNHYLYVSSSSQDNVYSVQRISMVNSAVEMCVDNLKLVSAVHYFGGHVYFSAASDSGSALFDLSVKP
ncbi:MAG: hypothetical protein ABI551_01190 [Polyangiaceae bacterium]